MAISYFYPLGPPIIATLVMIAVIYMFKLKISRAKKFMIIAALFIMVYAAAMATELLVIKLGCPSTTTTKNNNNNKNKK